MGDGHRLSWCPALRDLIRYDKDNGMFETMQKYHPMANELLTPLNEDIPSTLGMVDVDWMLRVAPSCWSKVGGAIFYFGAKTFWNTARGVLGGAFRLFGEDNPYTFGYGSMFQTGNRNAPRVAYAWVRQGIPLEGLFQPALELLKAECSPGCGAI